MNNVLDFEEEKTELDLLGKINNVLILLDEIDEAMEELPEKQSNIELLRSDLEHLLEDKEMGSVGYKNIARELEKVRKQRRHLKKAYEVSQCFKNNRGKITYKEQRPFVRQALETCFKELQTSYNYRLLNAKNIQDLLGNEKHETTRKVTSLDSVTLKNGKTVTRDDIEDLLNEGKTCAEIGELYELTASGVTRLKERLGIKLRRKASCKTTINVERIGNFNPRDITLEMYNELKEKGYSQEQMAEAWGIARSSVTEIKKRLGMELSKAGRKRKEVNYEKDNDNK